MSYDWGPHYIVPSASLGNYSGIVQLRESLDEGLLGKQLEALDLVGPITRISNPWYCRKKGVGTWTKIGESEDKETKFAVRWDTRGLENGKYEILGMMHVFVKKGKAECAIARQNIVELTVEN